MKKRMLAVLAAVLVVCTMLSVTGFADFGDYAGDSDYGWDSGGSDWGSDWAAAPTGTPTTIQAAAAPEAATLFGPQSSSLRLSYSPLSETAARARIPAAAAIAAP